MAVKSLNVDSNCDTATSSTSACKCLCCVHVQRCTESSGLWEFQTGFSLSLYIQDVSGLLFRIENLDFVRQSREDLLVRAAVPMGHLP